MKNKILKISILVIMMVAGLVILTGCGNTSVADNRRFVKINEEGCFAIYYDSKTKVQYAISASAYNYGNVTVLVDRDGKPLLYEE